MGQLEASCFAQGSDNTLYALAYGYDLSIQSGDSTVAVLLKSNASPSSPNALTWQVVSTIRKGELFSFENGSKVQCIADPDGAFLAWSYRANRPGQGATAQSRPGGIRYDPSSTTPSATTTGKGGWVNVETPLSYSWTSTSAGGDLLYLKDGSGKYNFFHAFIPGSVGTTINFGVLNTATTPNMMENSATTWSVRVSHHSNPKSSMIILGIPSHQHNLIVRRLSIFFLSPITFHSIVYYPGALHLVHYNRVCRGHKDNSNQTLHMGSRRWFRKLVCSGRHSSEQSFAHVSTFAAAWQLHYPGHMLGPGSIGCEGLHVLSGFCKLPLF